MLLTRVGYDEALEKISLLLDLTAEPHPTGGIYRGLLDDMEVVILYCAMGQCYLIRP